MQLVFALSFLALYVAVRGQTCSEEFARGANWLEGTSERAPPSGTFPSNELESALARDPVNARLYQSRQQEKNSRPLSSTLNRHRWSCPWVYRYIWRLNRTCWVVWPRLRYAHCTRRTCTHCESRRKGVCRPDCYFTYRYVLEVCIDPRGNWYLRWRSTFIRLPQICDCRLC